MFDDTGTTLIKKATSTIIVIRMLTFKRDLYALNLYIDHIFTVHNIPNITTWYNHLGHANYQAILQMTCMGMIEDMPKAFLSKPPICDHCILDKQAKMPVPKAREKGNGHKAMRRLEKVWVDLAGPSAVVSHTGNYYVMNIVDDYSDKPWSIPLKGKDDAFRELKAWILAYENESGKILKVLRTGHDEELNGDTHKEWYRSKGIILKVSAPYMSAHMRCIK